MEYTNSTYMYLGGKCIKMCIEESIVEYLDEYWMHAYISQFVISIQIHFLLKMYNLRFYLSL